MVFEQFSISISIFFKQNIFFNEKKRIKTCEKWSPMETTMTSSCGGSFAVGQDGTVLFNARAENASTHIIRQRNCGVSFSTFITSSSQCLLLTLCHSVHFRMHYVSVSKFGSSSVSVSLIGRFKFNVSGNLVYHFWVLYFLKLRSKAVKQCWKWSNRTG